MNDCDLTDVEHWGKVIKQVQIWSVDSSSVNNANLSHAHPSSCTLAQTLRSDWHRYIMDDYRVQVEKTQTSLPMLLAAHMTMISANERMGRKEFFGLLEISTTHTCNTTPTHTCMSAQILLCFFLTNPDVGLGYCVGTSDQIQIKLHAFNVFSHLFISLV